MTRVSPPPANVHPACDASPSNRDGQPDSARRRRFLVESSALTTGVAVAPYLGVGQAADAAAPVAPDEAGRYRVAFDVNGTPRELRLDPRVTLLDALRDELRMTGTKKGCDRGQCGACTVLVDGRRVNACLTLAVSLQGARVTTVEGLARGDALHPVQQAFLDHDAFQCGYCTPGQICSAVALIDEARAGTVSAATPDVRIAAPTLTDDEVRERMSGNLCRCGAYVNIVAAVQAAAKARG